MFTISPITKEQVSALDQQLGKSGTSVTSSSINNYQIIGHGINANAVFDETLGSLQVTVVHKPFYIPESAIQNGIEQALKSS